MIVPSASAASRTVPWTRWLGIAARRLADDRLQRRCTVLALLLAMAVVMLGAYVRLNNAGLSCPDWPGCYGHISVPAEAHDAGGARIEMTHRYLAGSLGAVIFTIFVTSLRGRRSSPLPALLLASVLAQALLGRWTVTGLLQPAVVTAHLLGGFTILSLLAWQTLRLYRMPCTTAPTALRALAALVLSAAAAQALLGGWTSSNHAALACGGFPQCQGQWWPRADYAAAFTFGAPGAVIGSAGQIGIHWAHRLGAATLVILVLTLVVAVWPRRPGLATTLLALLIMQVSLGITVVLLQRPLAAAVAHSFCAALLVLCLVAINATLCGKLSS